MSDVDVRVGKRAQVVIPAALRRQMGVKDGDVLHAELDERGRLVLERVDPDPLRRLREAARSAWGGDGDAVEQQRKLRAEWER